MSTASISVSDYFGNDSVEDLFGGSVTQESDDSGQAVEAVTTEAPELITEAEAATTEPTEPVAEVAEADQPNSDDKYFDHLELLAKMADCERRRAEIFGELSEAKEVVKDLNAQLKSCIIDMQEIASDIGDLMSGTRVPERKPVAAEPAAIESDAPGQEANTVTDWGDGEWRNAKTADVMDGTKGLGKKKLEALTDLAPTIGELEDLRGKSYGVFKSVLPNGFGDKVASEIEDRLIEYIAKHSVPPASEQVKQNAPAEVADDTAGDVTLAEVEGFIESYRNDAEIEKWDARDCDFTDATLVYQQSSEATEGYFAHEAGRDVEDFPTEWTAGQLTDWAFGYVCAEVMQRINAAKDEAPGQNLKIAETGEFDDL